MKLKFLGILAATMIFSGCSLAPEKAGIEIMSDPTAEVFINGTDAGATPYQNNSLKPGLIEIKLTANGVDWSKQIRLENRTNTVISRVISNDPTKSSGFTLNLEPTGDNNKAGLLVNSQPDEATVTIDNDVKGTTPMRIDDIGEGEKNIKISFPAYKDEEIFAKGIEGFQLLVTADLAEEESTLETATPEASVSATLSPTEQMVQIKSTETGWLRVRSQPDSSSTEVGRVTPGQQYKLVDENDDYYEIVYQGTSQGWISAKYAEKL